MSHCHSGVKPHEKALMAVRENFAEEEVDAQKKPLEMWKCWRGIEGCVLRAETFCEA